MIGREWSFEAHRNRRQSRLMKHQFDPLHGLLGNRFIGNIPLDKLNIASNVLQVVFESRTDYRGREPCHHA